MSPSDLAEAVAWLESRWGFQKVWGSWQDVYEDFAPYSAGALKDALHSWFREGNKFAPKPSELVSAVAVASNRRIEAGVDEPFDRDCLGNHRWSAPLPLDDDRRCWCVLCGDYGPEMRCEHRRTRNGGCAWCPERVA